MGTSVSSEFCDEFCCCFDRDVKKKNYGFCGVCLRSLKGDKGAISNYCSSCKILDNSYDRDGYYVYKSPVIMPFPHIEFTS